jgi:hypothetical protein
MKFGNELWLILFREYISPNLFAVCNSSYGPWNSAASPECLTNDPSSFSYGHCYSTYGPTNSVASHERLTNVSNSFSYGHWYSTYDPTNSVASPECLTNDPIPSLAATATLLTPY